MDAKQFFESLWGDYVAMTPQAARIKAAFEQRGELIRNDHVAFRTLAADSICLEKLEPHLLSLGYQRFEPYQFPVKKLRAYGYTPPSADLPRIFLSELMLNELSVPAQNILERCASQVAAERVKSPDILWAGRLWDPISWAEYELLLSESEYAAWVATIGIRPNHFTISVTDLEQYTSIASVLEVVESLGLRVNESGGRIKGSPEVLLEQASTMADQLPVLFADDIERSVPTCYYEFAKRYPDHEGNLFQGFVAASADRIFESTDTNRSRQH